MANDVWLESKISVHKWDHSMNCFFDLMVYAQCRLNVEEMRLFYCLAYFIWGQRNLMVHEGRGFNPVAVVHRTQCLLADYQNAWHGVVGEVSRERQVPREEMTEKDLNQNTARKCARFTSCWHKETGDRKRRHNKELCN